MALETAFSGDIPNDVPTGLQSKHGLLEPFGWYRKQRHRAPVQFDPDRGVWDVFGYDETKEIFHSPSTFKRPNLSPHAGSAVDADDPLQYLGDAMVWSDGTGHDTTKQNMFSQFTPRTLESIEPTIRRIARAEIRDRFRSGELFDFANEYAVPVTLKVPMELLGVPESDYDRILEWIETFDEVTLSEYSDRESTNPEAMSEAVTYFERVMAERAENPQDDLISVLVNQTPLDRRFIGANCFDILFAGQGTVTDFLSNAIYLHDQHGILTDANREVETVLEEVLRYRSPIQCQARRTTEAVTIGGSTIPADQRVICWIGSANRDPAEYTNPDAFSPGRNPDHLAFGHGSHSCIGFSLARLEASVVLGEFFDALGEIELLEDGVVPATTPQLLTYEQLPVRSTRTDR